MIEQFSKWLSRLSNSWVSLAALIIFVAFTALVLPRQVSAGDESVADAATPDLLFFYSSADLYQMAGDYGEAGRAEYVRVRFTFDLIWPLVYGFFLATAISWLYAKIFPADSPWQRLNMAPVLAMLLDYLENISTSLVMLNYPAKTAGLDALAPYFTALKWIFVGVSFVILLAGAVLGLLRLLRKTP